MVRGTIGKRNQYFIKKTFQIKIILRFLIILIIGGIISGVGLYYFASNELGTKLYVAHISIKNTSEILLPSIIFTSIIVFILLSIVTVYTVLYLSHKIAGPLYKFENIAEEIGKGNLKVYVKLRERDELLPLQNAFENMIENLKSKIGNFKKNFKKIKKAEKELNNAIQTSTLSATDKESLTSVIKEFMEENKKNLDAFTSKDV